MGGQCCDSCGKTVTGFLERDTISRRIANEVTVNGDLAVSRAFLADMRKGEASQIVIDDNVTVSGTAVANIFRSMLV